jgi:hypothetical protein
MPIRSRKNQYRGVNAHLNSLLQNTPGEWESFHASHIVDIARTLNQFLPAGYEARVEKSLQIRELTLNEEGVRERRRSPQPDVTIVDVEGSHQTGRSSSSAAAVAEITAPVIDTMDVDPERLLNAVVIYRVDEGSIMGKPVTRIELLSPANKPPAEGYKQYREKRNSTLNSGMPLVEIDYLHQTPPVAKNLEPYPQAGSRAYVLIVNDPRPSIYQGLSHLSLFDVDAPICCVDIPLDDGEYLAKFDFGIAYNATFENTPTYARIVDYEQEPPSFDAYSAEDQQRIRARMAAITDAVQRGMNLDTAAPLPIEG